MGKEELDQPGMFLSMIAYRAETKSKTHANRFLKLNGLSKGDKWGFCNCHDDEGEYRVLEKDVGIENGKQDVWRNGFWVPATHNGDLGSQTVECGENSYLIGEEQGVTEAMERGLTQELIDQAGNNWKLECRPRIPMKTFEFQNTTRAAIIAYYKRMPTLRLFGATAKDNCPNEDEEYTQHNVSMWSLDYDCEKWTEYAADSSRDEMSPQDKKLYHYAKEIKITYEVYSAVTPPEQGDVTIYKNRIHKNNSVVYQCTRVPLNTFVTMVNGGKSENFRDNMQKIPFVCVSVQCPKFDPIICDTNCIEQNECVNSIYEGKAVADYLFEYDSKDIDWAYEKVVQYGNFRLILARYSGARGISVQGTTVTSTCWPGLEQNLVGDEHNITIQDDAGTDLALDDGAIVLDDKFTMCTRSPSSGDWTRFCEEGSEQSGCTRCYYGFMLHTDGFCFDTNTWKSGEDIEKNWTSITFCNDLDNYCG